MKTPVSYTLPEGSLIGYMSNKVKSGGGINLAQGIPGFSPPEGLTDQLTQLAKTGVHQYAPGNGDPLLMQRIIECYWEKTAIDEANIMVSQGATEAITLVMLYLKNQLGSFSVIGFDPLYESYRFLPDIFGLKSLAFKTNSDHIDNVLLEKTIDKNKVKLMVVASPGNPYGKILSKNVMEHLVKITVKKDIYLLLDAVYQDIYFDNPPYYPYKHFNEKIFYVNSFSKKFSITGWRIGYLICHEKHMKRIRQIHDYTGLSASSVMQKAIALFMENKISVKEYTEALRNNIKNSYIALSDCLEANGFSIPETNGGYFIWAELPEKFTDGFGFAIGLYEKTKVAVVPGIHFSPYASRYVRFNVARPLSEIIEAGKKIADYCKL